MRTLQAIFTAFLASLALALGVAVISASAGAQAPGIYTARSDSNVRAEPNTNATIINVIRRGTRVQVLGSVRNGSWYQVRLDNDQTGYIYGRLLRATEEMATTPEQTTPAGADAAAEGRSAAPDDASVYFITPFDGEVIPGGKFWVRFGLRGMGVAPAGVSKQYTGHHHLLIDMDELPDLDEAIPSDDNHVHFGRGQTEVFLELEPGEHTLQLLLGDHDHIPHNPPVTSSKITVSVPLP